MTALPATPPLKIPSGLRDYCRAPALSAILLCSEISSGKMRKGVCSAAENRSSPERWDVLEAGPSLVQSLFTIVNRALGTHFGSALCVQD